MGIVGVGRQGMWFWVSEACLGGAALSVCQNFSFDISQAVDISTVLIFNYNGNEVGKSL